MSVTDFKKFPKAIAPGKFQGTQAFVTAVGMCSCGNPSPIVLIMHPGMRQVTTCNRCGVKFYLASFSHNPEKDPVAVEMTIGSDGPALLKPS
jgi:hypothetical protein